MMNNLSKKIEILIVEDNLVNQKVALYQLKSLGYETQIAVNGKDALTRVAQKSCDIILINYQFSDPDSAQIIQQIRDLEQPQAQYNQSRVVIIAVTTDLTETNLAALNRVGIDDYLSKPLKKEELATKLSYWEQVILTNRNSQTANQSEVLESTVGMDSLSNAIDWEHLHQISDNSTEFELELLQIFIQDTLMHLQGAKRAIAAQDCWGLEQEAHHVKGASANLGAKLMQAAAAKLEQQARQKILEGAEQLLIEIEQSMKDIQNFVESQI